MPITYDQADGDVRGQIKSLIEDHYPELAEAEVRVGCLVAEKRNTKGAKVKGSAVKLHGYECAAIIKINSLKDRAEGKPDATITLDGNSWEGRDSNNQRAILDHELLHLIVQRKRNGEIKSDDLGRPVLKMKLHDWELGGFKTIAVRYGDAAEEVKCFRHAVDQFGQFLLYETAGA